MDFDLAADFVRAGERVAREALPRASSRTSRRSASRSGPPATPTWARRSTRGGANGSRRRAATASSCARGLGTSASTSFVARGVTERVTPAPAPVGSRLRFGVDLRDGPLGPRQRRRLLRAQRGRGHRRRCSSAPATGSTYGWGLFGRADHDGRGLRWDLPGAAALVRHPAASPLEAASAGRRRRSRAPAAGAASASGSTREAAWGVTTPGLGSTSTAAWPWASAQPELVGLDAARPRSSAAASGGAPRRALLGRPGDRSARRARRRLDTTPLVAAVAGARAPARPDTGRARGPPPS
jgi:hypothetical protein